MKVCFYIESLGWGGAENVTALIAGQLAQNGHEVSILTDVFYQSSYNISRLVTIIPLFHNKDDRRGVGRTFRAIKTIRRYVKRECPDVSVAIMPAMFRLLFFATIGLKHKIVASDHTSFDRNLGFRNKFIRFYLYKFADAVTVLSQVDYDYLGKRLPQKVVMPNPLAFNCIKEINVQRKKRILAAGRLDAWFIKGFDLLIEAWSDVVKKHPDWTLEIAGGGAEKSQQELIKIIENNNVISNTSLIGFQQNIDELMRSSEIFVLSSRVEGFGMVLIEAMSQGCACVSFDCGGRQSEIIENNKNGIIISDYNTKLLSNAINILIEDDNLRYELAYNASNSAEKYSLPTIANRWENLLSKL